MKRALLVIDVQKIYTTEDSELCVDGGHEVVDNINALIRAFEKKGDIIIYVRHVHKKDQSDLGRMFDYSGEKQDASFLEDTVETDYDASLYLSPAGVHIVKNRYSAFVGTELRNILRQQDIDTVVVTGFMTNFCCESTAREAHDMDLFVDFVMDATGCPDLSDELTQDFIKKTTGETLAAGYANIVQTRSLLLSI